MVWQVGIAEHWLMVKYALRCGLLVHILLELSAGLFVEGGDDCAEWSFGKIVTRFVESLSKVYEHFFIFLCVDQRDELF